VRVQLPPLSAELCGARRPGHFDGVASVVCRLLNIVAPDVLVLGQKDYQQFVLMRRMVSDLRMPVELLGPTLREADGLAMSSRNRYLDEQQRSIAPLLRDARRCERLRTGRPFAAWRRCAALEQAGLKPDYAEVRRQDDLAPAT
jgi:pantoate--beta-alanine ligase